jgi:hypothetical protein
LEPSYQVSRPSKHFKSFSLLLILSGQVTVDGFVVKYIGREHAEHLMYVFNKHYNMEEDWKGELYCEINLKWNYKERYANISMPNYVRKKLIEYNYKPTNRLQYCPYEPHPIIYPKNWTILYMTLNHHPLTKTRRDMYNKY